jgi:hypothetical protein
MPGAKRGTLFNPSGLAIQNPEDIDKIVQKAAETGKEMSGEKGFKTNCTVTLYKNGF